MNLNGGGADNLAWGTTANFIGNNSVLKFGSTKSDNVLTFVDNIDLGSDTSGVRQIQVDDNPSSSADKTVLSGILSGTGILRKSGNGILELTSANTFSGRTEVVGGQVALSGSGSLANARLLTLTGGSGFLASGSAGSDTGVSLESLSANNGEALVTVSPASGYAARLTIKGLDRTAPGTILFRGTSLGSAAFPAADVANILFTNTTPLGLKGAGGPAGSTTLSIAPFARGDTSTTGIGTDFITYDAATGLRPLSNAEYSTGITVGQTQLDNVRLSGGVTNHGPATINSLVLNSGANLIGTTNLTVNSGALLLLGGNILNKPLAFGAQETVIHIPSLAATSVISSVIGGSAGIVKAGSGALILSNTTHTFTGPVTVSAGLLDLASGAVLANLYPAPKLHMAPGTTLRYPNNLYIGALDGSGTLIGTSGNNIFRFGFDNNDSTFGGTFVQTGGGPGVPGLDKLGRGVATITTPLGTLGSSVAVTDGTLRFYDLGSSPVSCTAYAESLLVFDDTATHVDNRTVNVTLSGEYKVIGNTAANTAAGGPANCSFAFGITALPGNPVVTLVPGAGYECQYRQRNGGNSDMCTVQSTVTALVRGDGLGQLSGTRSRFTVQSNNFTNQMIGGAAMAMADSVTPAGKAGTPQVSVIHRMYGDTNSAGSGNGFVTYDRGVDHAQDDDDPGIRPLTASEYATSLADGDGAVLSTIANTRLAAAVTGLNSATRINTLLLEENGSVAGAGTLTVESGLIMSTSGNAGIDTTSLAIGVGGAVRLITPESADRISISSLIGSGITAGLIKSGDGTAVLSNSTNTYSGATILAKGALRATDTTSLPSNSPVYFGGGVLESSGTFNRTLGAGNTQVRWDDYCSGGFAAYGGELNILLNNNTNSVTWDNTASFIQGHRSLILGSATANNVVNFQNVLSLGTYDVAAGDRTDNMLRTIEVPDNTGSSTDWARMVRPITGTDSKLIFVKAGNGLLELAGTNTYTGPTEVRAGTLLVSGFSTNTLGITVKSGAKLGVGIRGPADSGTLRVNGNIVFETGAKFTVKAMSGGSINPGTSWVVAYANAITGPLELDSSATGSLSLQTIGGKQAIVYQSRPAGTLFLIR